MRDFVTKILPFRDKCLEERVDKQRRILLRSDCQRIEVFDELIGRRKPRILREETIGGESGGREGKERGERGKIDDFCRLMVPAVHD
jgi:hypothetical protein